MGCVFPDLGPVLFSLLLPWLTKATNFLRGWFGATARAAAAAAAAAAHKTSMKHRVCYSADNEQQAAVESEEIADNVNEKRIPSRR